MMLVARESFIANIDGTEYQVQRAVTRVDSEHPLAKIHPEFWEELAPTYPVEQATAAPGEKRARTTKAKEEEG